MVPSLYRWVEWISISTWHWNWVLCSWRKLFFNPQLYCKLIYVGKVNKYVYTRLQHLQAFYKSLHIQANSWCFCTIILINEPWTITQSDNEDPHRCWDLYSWIWKIFLAWGGLTTLREEWTKIAQTPSNLQQASILESLLEQQKISLYWVETWQPVGELDRVKLVITVLD